VGSHRPLSTLAGICSGRLAPQMTLVTPGCAASPPMATVSRAGHVPPRGLPAPRYGPIGGLETARPAGAGESRALGSALAAPILSGQQPVGEGEVGEDPHAHRLGGRHQLVRGHPVVQRVLVLRRDEPLESAGARDPVGVDDLPRREVRRPDVADLPLRDELGERLERLLDRGQGIGPVQLVEVDVVGSRAPQAPLDGAADVGPGAVTAGALLRGGVHPELGRHDDLVTAARQGSSEQLLAGSVPVDVRGVEGRDAGVDRGIHDRAGPLGVDPGAEGVAPDADHRHLEVAVTEGAHRSSWPRPRATGASTTAVESLDR
jgi:hypothetical protein